LYQKRIQKLVEAALADAYFICSPENMYYFSGFTGGEGALFIHKDRQLLFTDSRYTVQAQSEAKDFEILDVAITSLSSFLQKEGKKTVGFEDDFVTFRHFMSLKKAAPNISFLPISECIYDIRMIKDATELSFISAAAKLADDAFMNILQKIVPGKTEREIALGLEYYMKQNGAEGLSFDTIVASGVRSAMPHGTATDKVLEKGDFITLDFGCKYKGYASDMTRTVVLGKANEKQKEIYEVVLSAQLAALNALSADVSAKAVDSVARDLIKNAGYGNCFGHGLGHSLGLMVHERPSLSPKSDATLKPNMLMTVEPGIYIENFGGVRIEDLVVITENGYKNLVFAPKELIEL